MEEKQEEIKGLLDHILKKLEAIELKIERQEQEVKTYVENKDLKYDLNDILLAHHKSMRTSVVLLREEIEELHQVMMIIFKEINNKS